MWIFWEEFLFSGERINDKIEFCFSDGSCWEIIIIKQIHTFTSNILFEQQLLKQYVAGECVDLLENWVSFKAKSNFNPFSSHMWKMSPFQELAPMKKFVKDFTFGRGCTVIGLTCEGGVEAHFARKRTKSYSQSRQPVPYREPCTVNKRRRPETDMLHFFLFSMSLRHSFFFFD